MDKQFLKTETNVIQVWEYHGCAYFKVIRNQHLVTSVLAQYEWPDETSGPEAVAAERKFWALRKDVEKRYPQVCADCEPKVEKRLRDASYTAQTDHLRRVMDRTRSQRQEVKRRGVLDVADAVGKRIWHLGFILQFWWHAALLFSIFQDYYSLGDGNSWMSLVLRAARRAGFDKLPHGDQLIRWAIHLSMFSLPWNPRFKQTIRGFTTHIVGFKQWYMYQILILLIRFICLSMSLHSRSYGMPPTTMLGAQLVIGFLMIYVSNTPESRTYSPDMVRRSIKWLRNRSLYNGHLRGNAPSPTFGTLNLADPPVSKQPEPQVQYEEEMDWSPSTSQYRAFSTYNTYKVKNINPRFSDTPIEPKAGPIWYKVPPAPTNPAQRLRNPPIKPIIRESPKEKKENFFRSEKKYNNFFRSSAQSPVDLGSGAADGPSDITFAEPKFYAPEPNDDPRDGLTRMFASSFSISPGPEDEEERRKAEAAHAGSSSIFAKLTGRWSLPPQNRTPERAAELAVLLAALAGWVRALGMEEEVYGLPAALASLCACLMVSIRLAADLLADEQVRRGASQAPLPVFARSWANLGWLQVVAALTLMWSVWSGRAVGGSGIASSGAYGNALFGVAIAHQTWHVFA
ncbi:hypothetical protein DL766_008194 [Monosporascus sp. MC13-8B]|uniref:Ima1 N-terminal domain-containing protein n=1 Tax=Monosporascus cannonballus TaxID=155416 RepID=A0ABY0GT80_9PEZI|nr:hypothetical protein DL762_009798 [Monosporascus cannonballus]RYP20466.1 hypothetical protein DL766_008194 [Monosporascus sp. MC13-8B]